MKMISISLLAVVTVIVMYSFYGFTTEKKVDDSSPILVKKNRPNVILIMADDLGYLDISPYGSKQVKTPYLQKMADQGMSFDNMFTSTAMCSPTRQQILTGLYPVRNGAYPNHSFVYGGTKSVAHYLQDAGYETAIIGKRDFGNQESFPFKFLGVVTGIQVMVKVLSWKTQTISLKKRKNLTFWW